jgi:hypothetical protein
VELRNGVGTGGYHVGLPNPSAVIAPPSTVTNDPVM